MKTCVLSILVFLPFCVWGQAQHELKLGVLSSLDKQPRLIYEYTDGTRLGFEAQLGYFDRFLYVNTADSLGVIRNIESFTQNFIVLGAALKIYFEPNAKGAGAFFGANFRHEIKVREEKGFDERFLDVYGEAPPSEADDLFSLGAMVGYKWLIAGHWIIEPQFAYSRNLVRSANTQKYIAAITLSLGYRF